MEKRSILAQIIRSELCGPRALAVSLGHTKNTPENFFFCHSPKVQHTLSGKRSLLFSYQTSGFKKAGTISYLSSTSSVQQCLEISRQKMFVILVRQHCSHMQTWDYLECRPKHLQIIQVAHNDELDFMKSLLYFVQSIDGLFLKCVVSLHTCLKILKEFSLQASNTPFSKDARTTCLTPNQHCLKFKCSNYFLVLNHLIYCQFFVANSGQL